MAPSRSLPRKAARRQYHHAGQQPHGGQLLQAAEPRAAEQQALGPQGPASPGSGARPEQPPAPGSGQSRVAHRCHRLSRACQPAHRQHELNGQQGSAAPRGGGPELLPKHGPPGQDHRGRRQIAQPVGQGQKDQIPGQHTRARRPQPGRARSHGQRQTKGVQSPEHTAPGQQRAQRAGRQLLQPRPPAGQPPQGQKPQFFTHNIPPRFF